MDYFPFMKECLIEFNYPKIHSMEDPEITDIFSKANRQFLVAWILKQVDEEYADIVESASKNELADILYSSGFCHEAEKNHFMNGECDSTKQFSILYKMFKHLKSTRSTDGPVKNLTLTELQDCVQFDTNLFPMYGDKKTLSLTQRAKKIVEYREEIERFKSLLDSDGNSAKNTPPIDPNLKTELTTAVRHLELNFPDFKRKVLDVVKNQNRTENQDAVNFGEDWTETLEACKTDAKIMLDYMKSMNVVMNFKENNAGIKNGSKNYESNAMMRDLAELCNEVLGLKRD